MHDHEPNYVMTEYEVLKTLKKKELKNGCLLHKFARLDKEK
jgi:3-dehydroquinate synthetase